MAISKTANEYGQALKHLLPPGKYYQDSPDCDKIMLALGTELSQFHAIANQELTYQAKANEQSNTLPYYQQTAHQLDPRIKVSEPKHQPFVAGSHVGETLYNNAWLRIIAVQKNAANTAPLIDLINATKPTGTTLIIQ